MKKLQNSKSAQLVSRRLIQRFCRERGLRNIVAFMQYISKGGLKSFTSFSHKEKAALIPTPSQKILFHGSPNRIGILRPKTSTGGANRNRRTAFVYATSNPNYAIFLAILNLQEGGRASVVVKNRKIKLSVNLGFVNGSSRFEDGYLHIVDGVHFRRLGNNEYASSVSHDVLFMFRVGLSDLTEPVILQTGS